MIESFKKQKHKKVGSPYIFLTLGFAVMIFAGAFLLWLPISTKGEPLSFIDALFTSTSSVCITGLSVVSDLGAEFTLFGKIIIAILIQFGGLGFVTIAMFFFTLLNIKLNVNEKFLLKETLDPGSWKGLVPFLKRVVLITFIVEFIGFVLNFIVFIQEFDFLPALGISAFHAISSFNNAGFDVLGNCSLINYSSNALLLINTAVMAMVGGLGFFVINDVLTKRSWKRLGMYSKIVIIVTLTLMVVGTLLLKLSEGANLTWLQAFFMNMTTRTAGFTVVNCGEYSNASLVITMFLMMIGASPCSTGGGLKTTTLFVLAMSIKSYASGKPAVAFYRRISNVSISRAYILTLLATVFVILIATAMSIFDPSFTLTQLLFESISAFATVGLTMGITTALSTISKILLCITMFAGRLGPMTLLMLLNKNWNKQEDTSISYVEDTIMIG